MGIRIETVTVKSYQRGGKAVSVEGEPPNVGFVPMGVSSNGYPVRIVGGKLFAYTSTEKGLPLREASDGENIGDIGLFIL